MFNLLRAAVISAAVLISLPSASAPAASDTLSILQLNIWQEGTVIEGGFDAIADEIARLNPDFVTLSEVRNYNDTRFCDRITAALASRGKTYHSFYSYDSGLLSRHPITDSATVFPHQGDHGTVYRMNTVLNGRSVAVYTGHLDYQNDTYYEIRGYDGNMWGRMDAPLTDVNSILARNSLSLRDEAIDSMLSDVAGEISRGALIFFGGDFNEPSHLDWIEATANLADHHGVVIEWPATARLHQAGFRDAYRMIYPDPVTHPGYTYPSDNTALPPEKITWAPLSDERDRIDYIFYYPRAGLNPIDASILGPRGSIVRSQRVDENSSDTFITPLGIWPTDHKGVFVKFLLESE